jgi:hypothetical protein
MLLYIGLDMCTSTRPQEEENRMYTIDQMGYVNAHNAAISEEIRRARIGGPGSRDRSGILGRLFRAVAHLLRTGSGEAQVTPTPQATN